MRFVWDQREIQGVYRGIRLVRKVLQLAVCRRGRVYDDTRTPSTCVRTRRIPMTDEELRAARQRLNDFHEQFKPYFLEQQKLPPEELLADYVSLTKTLMEEVSRRKSEIILPRNPVELDEAIASVLGE